MDANQGEGQKHTVYYDGNCPICAAMMEKVGAELRENITRAAAEKEIHVVDSEGKKMLR